EPSGVPSSAPENSTVASRSSHSCSGAEFPAPTTTLGSITTVRVSTSTGMWNTTLSRNLVPTLMLLCGCTTSPSGSSTYIVDSSKVVAETLRQSTSTERYIFPSGAQPSPSSLRSSHGAVNAEVTSPITRSSPLAHPGKDSSM